VAEIYKIVLRNGIQAGSFNQIAKISDRDVPKRNRTN
jgi:hypothetical protein